MEDTTSSNMDDPLNTLPFTRRALNNNLSSKQSSKTSDGTNKLNLCDILFSDMKINDRRRTLRTNDLRQTQASSCDGGRNASWGTMKKDLSLDHNHPSQTRGNLHIFKSHSLPIDCSSSDNDGVNATAQPKKSSHEESAKRLHEGIDDLLEMLRSTSFVGTIVPEYHATYVENSELSRNKSVQEEQLSLSSSSMTNRMVSAEGSIPASVVASSSHILPPPQETMFGNTSTLESTFSKSS